jgi:hypothetical protein
MRQKGKGNQGKSKEKSTPVEAEWERTRGTLCPFL